MFGGEYVKRLMIVGLAVLGIGVGLLVFTFIVAYLFLVGSPAIFVGEGLENAFAGILGPLVTVCIRVMFLGVMGWIGGVLSSRGIHLLLATAEKRSGD